MLQYISKGPHKRPMKKPPFQASCSDWATLANHCDNMQSKKYARKHIIHGEDWIKKTWNDLQKISASNLSPMQSLLTT
jgi:hypothetical protein